MKDTKEQRQGEIVIYKAEHGPELKVTVQNESIWLTQAQIASLFGTQRPAITKHLRNIYNTAELSENSVCSILEHTAGDGKKYKTQYYNLDAIIAVGYRVNSKRATQFRVWATQHLRDYLLKGFVVNQERLKEQSQAKLKELEGAVKLLQGVVESRRLDGYEKELLKIITDYTATWVLVNKYDHNELEIEHVTAKSVSVLEYEKALHSIGQFKKRLLAQESAQPSFGVEIGGGLKVILDGVYHTAGGTQKYPSVEEKGAALFYSVVKGKPFQDGNKRIGCLLLILFLIENHSLYNRKGERKLNESALVALALLIAESKSDQKDIMLKLVVNIINKK